MSGQSTGHPDAPRATLERILARHGLRVRGGWIPTALDSLPSLPDGQTAAVVWMVGQVGSECWSAFAASPFFSDGQADPLDRWSKSIGKPLAEQFGGVAVFPADGPPYFPFQQWAARAEPLRISPLLLQIHPEYGLWHAYRFALALPGLVAEDAGEIKRGPRPTVVDLCARCEGRPCLRACPVQAFDGSGYSVERCAAHLHRPEGSACLQAGCLARLACPVGTEYRYAAEHAAFHMTSFANRH